MARPSTTHNNNLDSLLSQLDSSVNEFMEQQDNDETYEDVLGGYATLPRPFLQQQQQQQMSANSRIADDLLDMYNDDDTGTDAPDNASETASSVAMTSPGRIGDYARSFTGSRASRQDSLRDDTSSLVEQKSPIAMNRSLSYGTPRQASSVDAKFHRQMMDETNHVQSPDHMRRPKDLPLVPVSVGANYADNAQFLDPRRRGSSSQQSTASQRTSSMSGSSRRREPGMPGIPQTYGSNIAEMHAIRNQIDAAKQAANDQARTNRDMLTQHTLQNLVPITKSQYPSQRPPPVMMPQQQQLQQQHDSWNSMMQPHMYGSQRSPSVHSSSSSRYGPPASPTNENRMSGGRMVSRSKSAHSMASAHSMSSSVRGKEKPSRKKDLAKGLLEGGLL
ncbi:hypothetical protein HDU78_002604 [Chytriomyces hyalinus]|nr:hypothetical protein HDU78_002604 [Chytriomyces hyalinus]